MNSFLRKKLIEVGYISAWLAVWAVGIAASYYAHLVGGGMAGLLAFGTVLAVAIKIKEDFCREVIAGDK